MTCSAFRRHLSAFLTDELPRDHRQRMEAHLSACEACHQLWQEAGSLWQAMDDIKDEPVPESLQERVLAMARIEAEAAGKKARERSPAFAWALFILLALVATLFSGYILSIRLDLEQVHPLGLTLAGALWMAFYGLIFYLFFKAREGGQYSKKILAQTALVAVAVFWGLTYASPVPNFLQFCSAYSLTQPLVERLSIAARYFLFGGLYALIPMLIAGAFTAKRYPGIHPLVHGTLAGVSFSILLLPGIFLHCAPFALGVLLGWFSGAFVGSLIGGAVGYWIKLKWV